MGKCRRYCSGNAYQNEIVNPVTTNTTDNATKYSAKIGLIYLSDYGFATDSSAWTTTLFGYNGSVNGSTISSLNWMYMGLYEWTIFRSSSSSYFLIVVDFDGSIDNMFYPSDHLPLRPSFYLLSSVTYLSGSGTQSDPIIIG